MSPKHFFNPLMCINVFLFFILAPLPADAHILCECIHHRWAGNCAHMCVVHANNATSCCGWKLSGRRPACGEWLTVVQWRVWADFGGGGSTRGGGGGGGEGKGGGGLARGVVSRDKARQMGQTMRHRHPPCMSTTPPGLLQTLVIPLSPPMCQVSLLSHFCAKLLSVLFLFSA